MINKNVIPSNLNEIDKKKEEIIQNNLGKITISNNIKKNNEKNKKGNNKKVIDEELKKQ